jgi:hypothetical protein
MRPGERVNLIKECATLLTGRDWIEVDLILREHGFPTSGGWGGHGVSNFSYAVEMLSNAEAGGEDALVELHRYLTQEPGAGVTGAEPWPEGKLRLFVSHLATHGDFAGGLNDYLPRYGVHGFVAHTSIEPSLEWQHVIETALATCDAMVVLLHAGFRDSAWCDQEIGYALARKVPILPVAIDLMPYGFLGKVQAYKAGGRLPTQVAAHVVQWLASRPSAHTALTEGLVGALESAPNYDTTRAVFTLLRTMPSLTPAQMQRLEQIPAHNNQVGDAVLDGQPVPDLIRQLIVDRGGAQAPVIDPWEAAPRSAVVDPWDAEPPF